MRIGKVVVGYASLGVLSTAVVWVLRDGRPWAHPHPWLSLPLWQAWLTSLVLGVVLALAVIVSSRVMVSRTTWARRLHLELRPFAQHLRPIDMVLLAVFSSLGEELLFRSLFTPMLGVIISSVLFGLAHQIPGPSRWVWVIWASLVGLALASIFAATGILAGCMLAHALVNGVNLCFLKEHDPNPRVPRLGGLFSSQPAPRT
jgi:uncharacterized protein